MVFPQTILPVRVELNLNGTWTDISSKVRADGLTGTTIVRGVPDESAALQPSTLSLSLNNRDGRFSPRNPTGIYYGLIGRNTPIRCSITGAGALAVFQESANIIGTASVSTPDTAALDIVGDIDVRFDADFTSWRDVTNYVTKWTATGNQRSYGFYQRSSGPLAWTWSTTGSDQIIVSSTVPLPSMQGRTAVRVTHDVNNGAAGNTVTFYYSSSISGTWTQLGDPVVTAGVTSIFSSSANVHVLQQPDSFNGSVIHGRVYAAQIYNGIAGSLVANPDFTVQTNGATSFADSTGKTWTVNASSGSIGLIDYDPRFVGEVTSWPQMWDQTGTDIWSPVECADVVRRLGQGQQPLSSTLKAFIAGETAIRAWWPMEDGTSATSFASGLSSGVPMTFTSASPDLASDATSFVASKPLPQFNGARFTGIVSAYSSFSIGTIQTRFLLAIPAGGAVNGSSLIKLYCTGSAGIWELTYGTGGTLTLAARDSGDTLISTVVSGVAFALNGAPCYVSIHLVQNAGNVDWALNTCTPGSPPAIGGVSGTLAGQSVIQAKKLIMNNGLTLTDTTVGHASVASTITTLTTDYVAVLNAYNGETATTRMRRLSTAVGVSFRSMGAPNGNVTLGPQELDTYLNVMQSAAATEGGILFSPKDLLGLAYRTVAALSAQPADATLDYSLNQTATFQPTEDDAYIRNDVTVSQPSGSSARVVDTTSTLSTQAPPLGVGTYDTAVTVNVATVAQLPNQAGWRVRVGTVDEARYPTIDVNLASYEIVAAALTSTFTALDIGDRLDVINPPAWLPPDTISQTIRGYTETLSQYTRYMSYNCSPAAPFNTAGLYGAPTYQASRYSSDGSTLNGAHNSTTTSLSVATASGPLWITTALVPADFPFDIRVSGERMTVTAVAGTTSPQTFTVTRSVNGVVKAQTTGTVVELFTPTYYSL
jgi:hypothetical protein